ncbi:MAG: DUF4123 domain-containing protein [Litorimonas sp.]
MKPLDEQFGVAVLKTVPDALYEPLFGQPDDTPLHTYAILDAAKFPNLPELLEVSGLVHRCLFKGDAFDELKDVAPWIVQLEDGNAFTRNLFTQTDAPWHLWDAEAGIYVRSGGTLDDMWKHFRKFTRVQDEQGKWFYFRFWETQCLIDYISFVQPNGDNYLRPLFGFNPSKPSTPLVHTYISTGHDAVKTCSAINMSGHNREIRTEIDMSIVRFLALRSHAYGFAMSYFLEQNTHRGAQTLQQAKEFSASIVHKYHNYGFKSRYHLGSFVYWALALNGDFETRTPNIQNQIQRVTDDPNDRFVLMAQQMKRVFGKKIRNYHGHGS